MVGATASVTNDIAVAFQLSSYLYKNTQDRKIGWEFKARINLREGRIL